jgi:hypothetical protein
LAVVELPAAVPRRHHSAQTRECVRTIASWKPLRPMKRMTEPPPVTTGALSGPVRLAIEPAAQSTLYLLGFSALCHASNCGNCWFAAVRASKWAFEEWP